jgi:hypothetical protein
VPRYACHQDRSQRGAASCLSLGALRVDQAVAEQVLGAIQPAGVQAALDAAERLGDEWHQQREALALALEAARYEAERARRQYDAIEPENRLVARTLEQRWETALARVAELEERLGKINPCPVVVGAEERERLLALGGDLAAVWHHPAAAAELKKRILRAVLREIVIEDSADGSEHVLRLHWQGGVHTQLRVKRNGTGRHRHVTTGNALEIIGELSKVCTDATIAATLNRLGYRTGTGQTWRAHSVANVRYYHRLANYPKGVDWLTVEQAAAVLGVSATVVRRLIKEGVLPASQVVASAPWIIARADLGLAAVRAEVQVVRAGRPRPSTMTESDELPS